MTSQGPRDRLIEAVVAHAAEHGLADTSLRQLASALGTSHRMLIHHFGSKEGLLVEVVRRVEERQRLMLAELRASLESRGDRSTTDELGAQFWDNLKDPTVNRHERLFFEVYGQALQGRAWAMPMLDGIVDDWVGPMAELFEAQGASAATSRTDARLAVAVARGLLLDLLATGDRDAVDAAMTRFTQLLAR